MSERRNVIQAESILKIDIEIIPIPKIAVAKQRPFIHLVDSILTGKAPEQRRKLRQWKMSPLHTERVDAVLQRVGTLLAREERIR